MRPRTTDTALALARRGVLIALGGTAVLAEASGTVVAQATAAGWKYLRAARAWRIPVIAPGRSARKR